MQLENTRNEGRRKSINILCVTWSVELAGFRKHKYQTLLTGEIRDWRENMYNVLSSMNKCFRLLKKQNI